MQYITTKAYVLQFISKSEYKSKIWGAIDLEIL